MIVDSGCTFINYHANEILRSQSNLASTLIFVSRNTTHEVLGELEEVVQTCLCASSKQGFR